MIPAANNQPYTPPYEIALYQLELAVDSHADPTQITAIAERILPLVRSPNGSSVLPPDLSAIVEFQILMSIIERCAKRPVESAKTSPFLTAIFENHLKSGFYGSICQLASLATGLGSVAALNQLAPVLEACPTPVLHAVFVSLSTDYQLLCPKAFGSVRNVSKLSLSFASVLAHGALLSARQMRLQTLSTDQFNFSWLEVVVEWLCDFPAIISCSPSGSSPLITSLSNFIILISTASVIVESNAVSPANSSWLQKIDRVTLKKLQAVADKLNSGLLLAAFSCSQGQSATLPKLSSSELTGLSFPLLTEAALMVTVPTMVPSILDAPIVRLVQHIQALRSAGIMQTVSRDDLLLLRTKFQPLSAAKLIDMVVEAVSA